MKTRILFYFFWLSLGLDLAAPLNAEAQTKNLLQVICDSRPKLKEALSQSGLSADLAAAGPLTFFAPSEETVQKMVNTNPAKLRELLMNQLVAGRISIDDLKDGSKLTTIGGSQIGIFRKKNEIFINGSRISVANIEATNGIMHEVENWLITPIASGQY